MPGSQLLELATGGGYDAFEAHCLELLENGRLTLAALVPAFEYLEQAGQADRLLTLTQMVFENVPPDSDPPAALALARVALLGSPDDEQLRHLTVALYERVHGDEPGFAGVLEASGLARGRAARAALRVLDLCLALRPGENLVSRMDGRVVEVLEIDRERGLFTLRREGRPSTVPAAEVAREYDRVARDDFRVLRQTRPEELAKLIADDPVAVVTGLIRAHGGSIDLDLLKHELVPRYLAAQDWSGWWARTRALLKRSPHVSLEGRAPTILRYHAEGRTFEEQIWSTYTAQKEPEQWLATVEAYLREKAARKELADDALLRRFHDHLVQYVATVRVRRPGEALSCALVIGRLAEKGLPTNEESRGLATSMLREAADPLALLCGVEPEALLERGFEALLAARPADWLQACVAWLPRAPASLLDKLATAIIDAGRADAVQSFIDRGLSDVAGHPELMCWLWKGPSRASQLRLPEAGELFRLILDTLSTVGRSVAADARVVKVFRQRMKAALAVRDYDKVRQCLQQSSEAAAITTRQQLERLEGLGRNVPTRLLDILREVHPQLWAAQPRAVAPWEDRATIWSTAAGLARRTAERDEIVNVKMPANAQRIGEAARHGDLSENSEYRFALEERDLLRARLATINDELSRARTLGPNDVPVDYVGIGSRVTLRAVADGAQRVLTFLGPFDGDVERGVFSYLAPVAQKLMGRRVGERVRVSVEGREVEFEIVALANALSQDGS